MTEYIEVKQRFNDFLEKFQKTSKDFRENKLRNDVRANLAVKAERENRNYIREYTRYLITEAGLNEVLVNDEGFENLLAVLLYGGIDFALGALLQIEFSDERKRLKDNIKRVNAKIWEGLSLEQKMITQALPFINPSGENLTLIQKITGFELEKVRACFVHLVKLGILEPQGENQEKYSIKSPDFIRYVQEDVGQWPIS